MTDTEIIDRIEAQGITAERLDAALSQGDRWGELVHAFEYLTVLGVVRDAMVAASQDGSQCAFCGSAIFGATHGWHTVDGTENCPQRHGEPYPFHQPAGESL